METNRDKEFDVFLKKAVKEAGLESPSDNFTSSLLAKIGEQTVYSTVSRNKPLIPRYVWLVLVLAVSSVFTFVVAEGQGGEIGWFSGLGWNGFVDTDLLSKFQIPNISNTVVYGFVILAIFMGIQVVLLKHHFDKRYAIN